MGTAMLCGTLHALQLQCSKAPAVGGPPMGSPAHEFSPFHAGAAISPIANCMIGAKLRNWASVALPKTPFIAGALVHMA